MGIFGKKIEKKYGKEEATEKTTVTTAVRERTRSNFINDRREIWKDIISEVKADVTTLAVDNGISEDTAHVYLLLKKYEPAVVKLIDSYYAEINFEQEKTEELEKILASLAEQSAKQNEIIENQNKILERMAKAIENANKIAENLCTKKEK